MGNIQHILGINVKAMNNGDIIIAKKQYTTKILDKFNMKDLHQAKKRSLREQQMASYTGTTKDREHSANCPYQEIIGS